MDLNKLCYYCMTFSLGENGVCEHCHHTMPLKQNAANALTPGVILHGRYMIGRTLGNGGFGMTYMALDLSAQRRVAVKEFMPRAFAYRDPGESRVHRQSPMDFEACMQKFEAEAQTLNGLRTLDNIVHIESLFQENDTAYYIMEYLQGQDLLHLLADKGGRMSLIATVKLVMPLFDTLRRIHDVKILHRDISPDNIYICDDGNVKLIDFGAARADMYATTVTRNVSLKPGYAALEQYTIGSGQGPWTDVYGLACTIYRCITGTIPPEANTRKPVDRLVPPSKFCVMSHGQENVLLKGLRVNAEDRWQTVTEFGNALLKEIDDLPSPPTPEPVPPEKPRFFWRRVGAYCLDYMPYTLLATLIISSLPANKNHNWIIILCWVIVIGIATAMESATGASLGKMAFKLQLYDKDGNTPPWWKCLLQNALRFCFPPDFLCFLVTAGKVSMHDSILDTYVGVAKQRKVQSGIEPTKQQIHSEPALKVTQGVYSGAVMPLDERGITMGRDPERCNLIFPEGAVGVSRVHCTVQAQPQGGVMLRDLGSSYGTMINGTEKLTSKQSRSLNQGDTFTIGAQSFVIVEK